MNPNIPSIDPTDHGHLAGLLKAYLKKSLQSTDCQLPCEIVSYNRITNRAMVRPTIDMLSTGGQQVQRAPIASIPVLALGGGGFCITFPLQAGDKGWIEASDRDISLYLQSMQHTRPNTFRMHSFEDGRFIPDIFGAYTHDSADDSKMVIQSVDGSVKITLGSGEIDIVAASVKINGIDFNSHYHGNVQNGLGVTGGAL